MKLCEDVEKMACACQMLEFNEKLEEVKGLIEKVEEAYLKGYPIDYPREYERITKELAIVKYPADFLNKNCKISINGEEIEETIRDNLREKKFSEARNYIFDIKRKIILECRK
jgi:hypothetical protein